MFLKQLIVIFARTPISKLFLSIRLEINDGHLFCLLFGLSIAYLIQNCNFYFYLATTMCLRKRKKVLIAIHIEQNCTLHKLQTIYVRIDKISCGSI